MRKAFPLAATIAVMSSLTLAKTIKLEAPTCGPPIDKNEVTVIDAREINDTDVLSEQLWEKLGPYSVVDSDYVETSLLKFSSSAVRKAKGLAAKKGCNIMVVLDRGRVGTGRYQATLPEGSNTAYGSEIQHGATTVVYACTWGSNGDKCPIPENARENWERHQLEQGEK